MFEAHAGVGSAELPVNALLGRVASAGGNARKKEA